MDNYYLNSLENDLELIRIFKIGIEKCAIQNFDSWVLSKLRRTYYSSISGILYLLGEKELSSTHGNKIEILAHVLKDEDFSIVHGSTKLSKKLNMNSTSWIEVKKNNRIWIYDVASMLKFSSEIFEALECPVVERRYTKDDIDVYPAYDDRYQFEYVPMIIAWYIARYEDTTDNPFYKQLKAEIRKYKKDINYSKAIKEYHEEVKSFKRVYYDESL